MPPSGLPLLRRLASTARRAADELSERLLGSDFEARVRVLRERYTALGGDPFGFDPETARFTRVRLRAGADVRQLLGRPGQLWGAESGADRLVVVRG